MVQSRVNDWWALVIRLEAKAMNRQMLEFHECLRPKTYLQNERTDVCLSPLTKTLPPSVCN
jgi:hypothetical protein